tara:strand:+ start:46 stop:405 length:360 start_codon:yes stop_codon:yes gene_type:complete
MIAIIVRFPGLIISFSFLFAFISDAQSLVFSSTESTPFLSSPPTLIYSGINSGSVAVAAATANDSILFVPNAFSPNNDGIKDLFYAKELCFESFDLKIYNVWGLVFLKDNNLVGWDVFF